MTWQEALEELRPLRHDEVGDPVDGVDIREWCRELVMGDTAETLEARVQLVLHMVPIDLTEKQAEAIVAIFVGLYFDGDEELSARLDGFNLD